MLKLAESVEKRGYEAERIRRETSEAMLKLTVESIGMKEAVHNLAFV
jgi:hypothetical protein